MYSIANIFRHLNVVYVGFIEMEKMTALRPLPALFALLLFCNITSLANAEERNDRLKGPMISHQRENLSANYLRRLQNGHVAQDA